ADPPIFEGHGDNQDVLFGPQTRPSPAHLSGYSAGHFGNLPFTPQWGLTDSSRMDNSRECHDMLANLFTPADEEFFNEALKEQHVDLVYELILWLMCKFVSRIRKELAKEKSLQDRLEELEEEKKEVDNLNSSQADHIKRLKEALKQAEADAEEEDIQAILTVIPNVDSSSSETFLPAYEKLFDQRYSYVNKVARMYLLDPTELQNIMPDEIGPTPGGGPCDTPTPS
ncbi:hypothetical protein Tco_0039601, partial [Tanacetum coccineum]